jgi:hypothetical protein
MSFETAFHPRPSALSAVLITGSQLRKQRKIVLPTTAAYGRKRGDMSTDPVGPHCAGPHPKPKRSRAEEQRTPRPLGATSLQPFNEEPRLERSERTREASPREDGGVFGEKH